MRSTTAGSRATHFLEKQAMIDGARTVAPIIVPALPFGLVLGVAINESGVNPWLGWAASFIIFAGSAQLAAVQVLSEGAGIFLTAVTVWIINARHIMYSAAMASRHEDAPRWIRLVAAYFLLDQNFAISEALDVKRPVEYRASFLIGAGILMSIVWNMSVGIGVVAGGLVPESWSLDFAVPVLFLILLILAVSNRPGVLAAIVGGVTAVLAADMPNGSGLLLAAVLGIIAGGLADAALERDTHDALERDPQEEGQE